MLFKTAEERTLGASSLLMCYEIHCFHRIADFLLTTKSFK